MKTVISCEFSDFDSAERAMYEVSRMAPDKIKISLNRKSGRVETDDDMSILPILPISGTSSLAFPLSAITIANENTPNESELDETCHLLISTNDSAVAKKISNRLSNMGGLFVKQIKY